MLAGFTPHEKSTVSSLNLLIILSTQSSQKYSNLYSNASEKLRNTVVRDGHNAGFYAQGRQL